MNVIELIKFIKSRELGYIKIEKGPKNDPDLIDYFPKGNQGIDTAELVQYVTEFFADFPGKYTVHLKKSPSSKNDVAITLRDVTGYVQTPNQDQENNDLETEIEKRVRLEYQVKDLERQLKEMEETESAGPMDRVQNALLEKLIDRFTAPARSNTGPVNGINGASKNDILKRKAGKVENQDQETEKENTEYAINVFLKYIDPETLNRFAHRIERDPNVINQLKMFL